MNIKNLNINVVFVVIVAILGVFFIKPNNNDTINVYGTCSKKVNKDRVSIILNVKNLDKDGSIASQKSNKTYNTISQYVAELKKQYPEIEMETTEYNTYEKKEWNQNLKKNETLGIETIIGLEITAPKMEIVSNVLKEVSKLKDVYPNGFRTFVSKATIKQAQAECLDQAVKNAKLNATDIASAAGQKIGKMTNASVYNDVENANSNMGLLRMSANTKMSVMEDFVAPSLFAGNTDLTVNVNATFELK